MELFERLKKLATDIYGEKVFKSIQEEVKKKIEESKDYSV